jgi:hypothetical protein
VARSGQVGNDECVFARLGEGTGDIPRHRAEDEGIYRVESVGVEAMDGRITGGSKMISVRAVVFGTLIWAGVIFVMGLVVYGIDYVLSLIFGIR